MLETEMDFYSSDTSGDYGYKLICDKLQRIMTTDRENIASALRKWLASSDKPRTLYVIGLVQDLRLREMISDLLVLKTMVMEGKVPFRTDQDLEYPQTMKDFYLMRINDAIKACE
jgi:hypothetical protein